MSDYSYIGSGKVYCRVYAAAAGLFALGNVSSLSLTVNEDVKKLKDYTQPGGGVYNQVNRIDSVEASMTLHDLSADNIARHVFGDAAAIDITPVVDESHENAFPGSFVPTNKPGTVTGVKVGMVSLAENTDYTVVAGGILIADAGTIDYMGDTVLISYTPSAGNAVQALLNSAQDYEIFFSGLNEARSGKAVTVKLHRVKLGAAQNLAFIGDDFAALEVKGEVLKDSTKNGTSESQYFEVNVVT